jgi:hypothetical protein
VKNTPITPAQVSKIERATLEEIMSILRNRGESDWNPYNEEFIARDMQLDRGGYKMFFRCMVRLTENPEDKRPCLDLFVHGTFDKDISPSVCKLVDAISNLEPQQCRYYIPKAGSDTIYGDVVVYQDEETLQELVKLVMDLFSEMIRLISEVLIFNGEGNFVEENLIGEFAQMFCADTTQSA